MKRTKMPAIEQPLIRDPDLRTAVNDLLAPHTGAALERAQEAVREVHASGFVGSFGQLVDHYRDAIALAIKSR